VVSETRALILKSVYNMMLTYPTRSDREISDKLNLGHATVSRYRQKLYTRIDHQLSRNVASKFLTHFQMASDYFMKQIENLENLKSDDKLSIMEIAALERQQTELWSKIVFLCRQSEAIEVIKLLQHGELPTINN